MLANEEIRYVNRKAFDTSFLYWVDFTNFWKSFLMRFLCFMSCNELKLSNYFCQIVVGNLNRLKLLWSLHNISIDESHRTRLWSHIAHKHFGGVGCNEPPPSLGIPVSAGSVERKRVSSLSVLASMYSNYSVLLPVSVVVLPAQCFSRPNSNPLQPP